MRHARIPDVLARCVSGTIALALGGCNAFDGDTHRRGSRAQADASPAAEVDIDELQDEPLEFHGREVRLLGEIDDPSHGDHAFVMQGDDWLFPAEVLIVGARPMRLGGQHLADGEEVVVIGTVWVGDMPALEREVGWPIGENMADDWEDKAVVVARVVRSTDDDAEWTAPDRATR